MDTRIELIRGALLNSDDTELEELISLLFKNYYYSAKVVNKIFNNTEKKALLSLSNDLTKLEEYKNEVKDKDIIIDELTNKLSNMEYKIETNKNIKIISRIIEENESLKETLTSTEELVLKLENELKKVKSQGIGKEFSYETGHTRLDVDTEILIDAYTRGIKVADIAKTVGMTINGVRQRLIKAGVWKFKDNRNYDPGSY